jgi:hypothetical protein
MCGPDGKLRGAEVVIDEDRASAVLARELASPSAPTFDLPPDRPQRTSSLPCS